MTDRSIAIVGAGLSGAAVARTLYEHGYQNITVFDERPHLAGNAHTERDPSTGIMVHKYGPHIFHTDDAEVWRWFDQYAHLVPYVQRTKGIAGGKVYSLPINLHTINQFFEKQMSPAEAKHYIETLSAMTMTGKYESPTNFEDYALSLVGRDLYRAFLRGYTIKQWDIQPTKLPASILKRLPLRFDYNDNAFFHKYQGIPRDGYTDAIKNVLTGACDWRLRTKVTRRDLADYDHVFYTGPIDEWFDYQFGPLAYRTLDITHNVHPTMNDLQGCSVLNNCDLGTPWTRRTEHKHFTPWEEHKGTVISEEQSRDWTEGDIRYYPLRLVTDKANLSDYQERAAQERNTTFVGRLATYRYLDMDQCLREAIEAARVFATGGIPTQTA